MPPSRLSRVVLPDPDGPITATKSPLGMARLRWSKMVMVSLPLVNLLQRSTRPTIGSLGDELLGGKLLGDNMGYFPGVARESDRPAAALAVLSSRNVTLIAMSGRMRVSLPSMLMRTLTVAFSRLAVGTMAMTAPGMIQSG